MPTFWAEDTTAVDLGRRPQLAPYPGGVQIRLLARPHSRAERAASPVAEGKAHGLLHQLPGVDALRRLFINGNCIVMPNPGIGSPAST